MGMPVKFAKYIYFFIRSALPIRFEKALNDYQIIIFDQDMTQNVFDQSESFKWSFRPRHPKNEENKK